jgi:hypothetical protein
MAENGVVTLGGVTEDRSGDRVDHRRRWRELRLTPDATGVHLTGRGTLESEWLNADQSVRIRTLVTYEITADRATSLPTPTAH